MEEGGGCRGNRNWKERGYERTGREEGKLKDNKGKSCSLRTKYIRGERGRTGRAHISERKLFF